LGSYLITSPKDQERYGLWARVAYDDQGRPMKIADNRNCDIGIEYDDKGCLSSIESSQGFISIERKSEGTKEHIVTSWGISQTNSYDAESGFIQEEKVMNGEDEAVVRFDQGRPVKVQQFDGGEAEMAYHSAQHCEGFIRRIRLPDGSEFTWDYDKKGRLYRLDSPEQYEMLFKYDKKGRLVEMVQKRGSK